MQETLTVQELIDMLQDLKDKSMPLYLYNVGMTASESFAIPLTFKEHTISIDLEKNKCHIDFTTL